jgi:20S proteasome alpha/beta subunit
MMNDNSVSSFMAMADAALEKALRADLDLAEAKRCAQEDVRKAIEAGLISVRPCGVPGKYKKKDECCAGEKCV